MITAITLCPPLFEPGLHGLGESKWVKASQFYAQTMGISTKQPRDSVGEHFNIICGFWRCSRRYEGTMKNNQPWQDVGSSSTTATSKIKTRWVAMACRYCSDRGGRRGPDKTWWHCKPQQFMESISLSSPFCLWSLLAVHRRPGVQATCTETANLSLRTWNNPQERWSSPLDSNSPKKSAPSLENPEPTPRWTLGASCALSACTELRVWPCHYPMS